MRGITGGSTGFCRMSPQQKADAKARREAEKLAREKWMAKRAKNKAKVLREKERGK